MQSLWMLLAALFFALLGVFVKLGAEYYSVAELVLYRSLFPLVGMALYAAVRRLSLRTDYVGLHLRRSVVGTVAFSLWFYATTLLPMGTALTLNYTSPLFMAAFVAGFALRGRAQEGQHAQSQQQTTRSNRLLMATVTLGFCGVTLILQPSIAADQTVGALTGLASGFLSAAAYWQIKALGAVGEPAWRVVAYFSAVGTTLGFMAAAFTGFSEHSLRGAALLLAIGASATIAQLAVTRAYGHGRTLLTSNLQFAAIVFGALFGWYLFDDRITAPAAAGIVIIVASGILATWITARAQRVEPSAEK